MRRREFISAGAIAVAGALSSRARSRSISAGLPLVAIVGGGFAGASCAMQLRRLNPKISVTLVDPVSRYVTCPMSNEALVGLRTMQSITIARDGLQRAGIRYICDRVTAIDADQRKLRLRGDRAIAYDRLVVAPGIRFLWGNPEGYDEVLAARRMPHAWQAGVQTRWLAEQLQSISNGSTIAISVPPGLMRCPPGPYERASLIAYWLKRHKPRSKVVIFDANNHFPRQDVFASAWAEFYPDMIEWIPATQGGVITRVDARRNILYSSAGAHKVAVANIIPPQAPGQLVLDAGLASGHGWSPIKPASFESQLVKCVHVIGDACIADAMPKSASAAHSQALQCAAAIAAAFEDREPPAAKFESVCYSVVAPRKALAIHAKFRVIDAEIDQIAASADAPPAQPSTLGYADEATDWYKTICSDSFGI